MNRPFGPTLTGVEALRKGITRENAKVDRIACPWLIRRFIDPDAEFLYVPASDLPEVAAGEGATAYDVPGVELGHVVGRCSFERMLLKFGLTTVPALVVLGQIVHAADVAADIGTAPELDFCRFLSLGNP